MPNLPFVTSWIMRARIVLRYIPAFATAKPAFHRTIALTSFAPLTLPQIRFRANWSLQYNKSGAYKRPLHASDHLKSARDGLLPAFALAMTKKTSDQTGQ